MADETTPQTTNTGTQTDNGSGQGEVQPQQTSKDIIIDLPNEKYILKAVKPKEGGYEEADWPSLDGTDTEEDKEKKANEHANKVARYFQAVLQGGRTTPNGKNGAKYLYSSFRAKNTELVKMWDWKNEGVTMTNGVIAEQEGNVFKYANNNQNIQLNIKHGTDKWYEPLSTKFGYTKTPKDVALEQKNAFDKLEDVVKKGGKKLIGKQTIGTNTVYYLYDNPPTKQTIDNNGVNTQIELKVKDTTTTTTWVLLNYHEDKWQHSKPCIQKNSKGKCTKYGSPIDLDNIHCDKAGRALLVNLAAIFEGLSDSDTNNAPFTITIPQTGKDLNDFLPWGEKTARKCLKITKDGTNSILESCKAAQTPNNAYIDLGGTTSTTPQ